MQPGIEPPTRTPQQDDTLESSSLTRYAQRASMQAHAPTGLVWSWRVKKASYDWKGSPSRELTYMGCESARRRW